MMYRIGIILMAGIVLMMPGIIVLKDIDKKKRDHEKSKEVMSMIENRSAPQKEFNLPENVEPDFSGCFDHD